MIKINGMDAVLELELCNRCGMVYDPNSFRRHRGMGHGLCQSCYIDSIADYHEARRESLAELEGMI